MNRSRKTVLVGQLLWMLYWILHLAVFEMVEIRRFFLISFVGFLGIVVVTSPIAADPFWRRRVRWLVTGGAVVALLIILEHAARTLLSAGWA